MANYSDIKYQPAGAATTIYSDMSALVAATGMSAGDQALVTALNKVFMYTGTAWYTVATMTNASPTAITGVDGTYTLATDGTATTITAVSTDPEGFALTWSYAVTTGSIGSTATVSQADNVFTITPSTTEADAGSFSITFSVTDGATGAVNAVSAFTLAFIVIDSGFNRVRFLSNFDGSNNGVNNSFVDVSTSNHSIFVAGDTQQSSFTPYGDNWALQPPQRRNSYSSGASSRPNIVVASHADFGTTASEDYTWEYFIFYMADLNTHSCMIFDMRTGGGNGDYHVSSMLGEKDYNGSALSGGASEFGKIKFNPRPGQSDKEIISDYPLPDNQWSHFAAVRESGTISMYVNGARQAAQQIGNTNSGNAAAIRFNDLGWSNFSLVNRYAISNVRFVKGTAVYSGATISVPTSKLTAITNTKLLLFQDNRFVDNSSGNHSLTVYNPSSASAANAMIPQGPFLTTETYNPATHGGSAYFDGSGDYLTGPTPATIGIGTGDFTIECWFYATDATTDKGVWDTHTNASNSDGLTLTRITETTFRVWQSSQILVSSATAITNNWNHLAVVRNSGTLELFVNGVSQGTVSNSTNMNSAQGILIGGGRYSGTTSPTQFVKGYIQDFRVLTSAIYTSNFTPPTAPLTAITNTAFLSNMSNGQVVDATKNAYISLQGNTKVTHSEKKFGTGSLLIEGNGDGALVRFEQPEHIKFGESDFTMELHVRFITVGPTRLLSNWSTSISGQTDEWSLGMLNSTTIQFQYSGGPTYFTWAPSADTWYHIAITKESTNLRIFIDGVQIGTTVTLGNVGSTDPDSTSTSLNKIMNIGGSTAGSSESTNMYIDNVRISDFARYTSGFTPPTTEHGTQGQ